jgi:uncharacterized short protein YbdD (DUF466 family)
MYSAKIYETVKQNYMSKLYVQYLEFFKEWLFVDAPYPGGGERC